jgi:hypothetical protein
MIRMHNSRSAGMRDDEDTDARAHAHDVSRESYYCGSSAHRRPGNPLGCLARAGYPCRGSMGVDGWECFVALSFFNNRRKPANHKLSNLSNSPLFVLY